MGNIGLLETSAEPKAGVETWGSTALTSNSGGSSQGEISERSQRVLNGGAALNLRSIFTGSPDVTRSWDVVK